MRMGVWCFLNSTRVSPDINFRAAPWQLMVTGLIWRMEYVSLRWEKGRQVSYKPNDSVLIRNHHH